MGTPTYLHTLSVGSFITVDSVLWVKGKRPPKQQLPFRSTYCCTLHCPQCSTLVWPMRPVVRLYDLVDAYGLGDSLQQG